MNCPSCQRQIPDTAVQQAHPVVQEVSGMKCPQCGTELFVLAGWRPMNLPRFAEKVSKKRSMGWGN